MADININEYVRTEKGIIDKVIQILNEGIGVRFLGERLEDTIIITNGDILSERRIDSKEIVKHSFNKLDLLQVGDLIRFKELRIFTYNFGTSFYSNYISEIHSKEELKNIKKEIKNKKIRLLGIITKEQFSNIEYRLED